jgi:hypothetical protein
MFFRFRRRPRPADLPRDPHMRRDMGLQPYPPSVSLFWPQRPDERYR